MDIVATGMICSVGLTAASACAAIRARIAKFDELPYRDNHGEPIVGAAVAGLDVRLKRRERLIELLSRALSDCLETGGVKQTERIPLLVGLAEPGRPGGGADWAGSIIRDVEARLKVRFNPKCSTAIPKGHTSGFEALRLARELLQNPAIPACLVCGVDSYINASALWWLDRHWRLKTTENSDGVIPGEAAACVLLVRPESEPREGCVARVIGLGFAQEKAAVLSEIPLLGLGLTEAARAALGEAQTQIHEIHVRLSDGSGESYGFREQALMVARLLRVHCEELPIWHCADMVGDGGAAAGVCQLVITSYAFQKDYAPGARALCLTSSVQGDRAAAVLTRSVMEANRGGQMRGGAPDHTRHQGR